MLNKDVYKKKIKKTIHKKRNSPTVFSRTAVFFVVGLILAIGILGKSFMSQETYKVLGAKTVLAKGGDDSGGGDSGGSHDGGGSNSGSGSSGGSSNSGSSGSSGGGGSSGSENSGGSGGSSTSGGGSSVSDNTKVVCTGPDGKQFETSFKGCNELNKAWNKEVRFTIKPNQEVQKIETRTSVISPSVSKAAESEVENETEKETGLQTENETKLSETKTEVRLSDGERIRTTARDGRTRIDITSGGIKTRFEVKDDKVIVKAEQEDGTETELADDALAKIDDRLAKDDIKVATAGAGQFLLQKGDVKAITSFPISVDLATNTLFITTPNGQKAVTILPEKAMQNLLAAHIINVATSAGQLIALDEKNGIPVYEVKGVSSQRLFGLIPIGINKEITVSAETGNALSIRESLGQRILDAISF